MLKNASYLALSLSLASLGACSGSSGSSSGTLGGTGTTGSTNSAPVVSLGSDLTVTVGQVVALDATVSDADGDALTYIWSSNSGSITLSPTNTEDTGFTAPSIEETIILTLSVSDGTATSSDTITITVDDGIDDPKLASWVINTSARSTSIFETAIGGTGALTDVQTASEVTIDAKKYMVIETDGIPTLDVTVDQDLLDTLNARPRSTTHDFLNGIDVVVGDVVSFGEDIGYNTSSPQTYCGTNGGVGYWPPGPDCPAPTGLTAYVPLDPVPTTDECTQGLGTLGIYVNGFAVFGWGDGMTDTSGNFTNSAAELEQYDLDICAGHAAMGEYHNHNYSQCMADLVGDTRDAHSPIYGFAADGYAIHGPWESNGVLAVSAWVKRDYGLATTAGGCGTGDSTQRACVLVDEYDVSQGVTQLAVNGPDTDTSSANYSTPSGNPYAPVVGTFYEDFYFADNPVTGAQLDQNNGHDTNDGNGYHYHITLETIGGELKPAFPYTFGPQFSGELADNSFSSCGGVGGGGPGGGMGG